MTGRDEEVHAVTVEASSVFDAADKAVQSWRNLSWFDRYAPITVESGEKHWTVSQEYLKKWREATRQS
jgi:surfactin synthase thioesterase subunit